MNSQRESVKTGADGAAQCDLPGVARYRRFFDGSSLPTALPGDKGPPGERSGSWIRANRALDPACRSAALALAASMSVPLRTLVEASWALVLSRVHGEADVVFGVASPGRSSLLPVRVRFDASASLSKLIEATRTAIFEMQAVPPEDQGLIDLAAHSGQGPLFQSAVIGADDTGVVLPKTVAWVLSVGNDATPELRVASDPERFDPATLEQALDQITLALCAMVERADRAAKDVELYTDSDARTLSQLNARAQENAPEHCVHALFTECARRTPDAVAVLHEAGSLTYGQLDARSDALALRLCALGVTAGDAVGLCLERSAELAVTVLGILKAGGAYLPLEPDYPEARIRFLLEDAKPRLVVTRESLRSRVPGGFSVLSLDGPEAEADETGERPATLPSVSPAQRAYIMYTSGSTGTPKGVEVPHRAIERLVKDVDYAKLGPAETILQAAPLAFDASTFEIWGALLNGGRLVPHAEPIPTARGLGQAIRRYGVTTMWLTAALFNAVVDEDPTQLGPLRQLLTGGEVLSVRHVRRGLSVLGETQIINGYGPTETTTFATCHSIPRGLPDATKAIPIGRAIRQTRLYVFDDDRRPVPIDSVGELYIGGKGVALGYLNRPELTRERFVGDPSVPGETMYRTGDLVRMRRDGVVEYLGRADQQVKIRGFRIELGEIEHALTALAAVKSCVVVARPTPEGEKRLVAYIVARVETDPMTAAALRQALLVDLPDYMVPSAFVFLPSLPVTANGKVDYRALPAVARERPDVGIEYVAPRSEVERALAAIWEELLDLAAVGVHDNLFALGANSLMAIRAASKIERAGHPLSVIEIFQRPTVADLAAHLVGLRDDGRLRERLTAWERSRSGAQRDSIAIIGMAGRFPGAPNVDAFWANLVAGRESITHFGDGDLDPSLPRDLVSDPSYVRARGVLENVDEFDASFFRISPKEAEIMDPQQRVLMEVAWETLENGGYTPDTYAGTIGIFVGKYNDTYFSENVVTRPDLVRQFGEFQTMLANEKDYVATRIASCLNLTGPAVSTHTACSTSLVNVVHAMQSLTLGQCDMALAGGVAITVPVKSGYLYQEGAMLSPDGHTRSFDAHAQGTVFSDGAAMVLLKRLSDAVDDGDTIYAVIRGGAINNDGARKASFTAPSAEGQAAVIALAQADAGVDPRAISYVETHGTATPVGDPIEIEGLTKAFRLKTSDRGFCAIGSVKSNVGHLVIAAGATGVIKTALALREEVIPPSILFDAPNPMIDFDSSPFYVAAGLAPWKRTNVPRIAGVSSFGVGGTNAHVVMQEAPLAIACPTATRPEQLLFVSARSESALATACARIAAHLETSRDACLRDVAYTLHAGRTAFPYRRAVVAGTASEAASLLRTPDVRRVVSRKADGKLRDVVFMFPGQGSQHPRMGASLYRTELVFRTHVDDCAKQLQPLLGVDLRNIMFSEEQEPAQAAEMLDQTAVAQPALFVIEYALARLWMEWGVAPKAMIGHSVGEFVAAALAGVMPLEDALRLVAERGRLMQAQPPGSMLSVRLPPGDVQPMLSGTLVVASENGPSLCVVAGPIPEVAALQQRLEGEKVACRLLRTSHAFHSPMMDPVIEPFGALVRELDLREPRIPFVSTATGDWIDPAQARDPMYWAMHLRRPVRFAKGVAKLWEDPTRLLLEVGPRSVLATLSRQQIRDRSSQICLGSLGESDEGSIGALLLAVGQLWTAGLPLSLALHGSGQPRRVPLPTYPFERRRFWIDAAVEDRPDHRGRADGVPLPVASSGHADPIADIVAEQLRVMRRQLELVEQSTAMEDGAAAAASNDRSGTGE
jgi:amino acid adenylation domain-containing protein